VFCRRHDKTFYCFNSISDPPPFTRSLAICTFFAPLALTSFLPFQILAPITDRIRFGDDIFLLRGEAYFTGCMWIYTTLIGLDVGIGMFGGEAPGGTKGGIEKDSKGVCILIVSLIFSRKDR